MMGLAASLPFLLGLPPATQEPDSPARDHVAGSPGAHPDSQLARFAFYDPANQAVTRLRLGPENGRSPVFHRADGGQVSARRE